LKLTFIADIPTPYMSAALQALSERVDLQVIYCSMHGSRGMNWSVDESTDRFSSTYVGGGVIKKRKGTDRYPNPKIIGILRRQEPDVILSGGYGPHTLYALAFARFRRIPLLIYCDGWAASEADLSIFQRLARRVVVPRASGFVANSTVAAARFIELGTAPNMVSTAPHTTDMSRWLGIADKEQRDGNPETLRLLCVGRLVTWKGVEHAIAAVAQARRRIDGISLTVVGTGPDEDRLREIATQLGQEDAIRFAGFTEQADLPTHLDEADVFLFPTLSDPFGVALLEAAAAGLPHVASPHGGATWELASDGVTGFVVDPAVTETFADRIVWLAQNPGARLEMGSAARARARHRTPEYAAAMYERAALRALNQSGSEAV
jgi:glycosyltransferase involved in cell wall biosynthesis